MALGLALPFTGLPTVWVVVFAIAFAVICGTLLWTTTLYLLARRQRRVDEAPVADDAADAFAWVFLVPALNEELTIRDSVTRLLALPVARAHVVVIDDGSDDGTAAVLDTFDDPRLHVVSRRAPDARKGKAAALNHAYGQLGVLLGEDGTRRDQVIVVVVDADGRLDAQAPRFAAARFSADARVGGVQSLVRIYNRDRPLTWLQDVEFAVYGGLYQAGRSAWGTAGMGGNGQFNRLLALDAVADHDGGTGPWRDRLTEDQDLGLRLLAAGWLGRQELRAVVEQQGLRSLRRLYRQRTRWSQGNLQAMSLLGSVWRAPVTPLARLEQVAYLLLPVWQSIVGLSLVCALILTLVGTAGLWETGDWWQLAFFYVLGFGGVMMGCLARAAGRGPKAQLVALLVAQVYAFYAWLLWPALVRATVRQLVDQRDWVKTPREAVTDGPPAA